MDDRSDQGSRHCSHILGLSVANRRVIETHVKLRDSTGQTRLFPLCSFSKQAENNIEMILRGDRWTTAVTKDALQPHLRAICYR